MQRLDHVGFGVPVRVILNQAVLLGAAVYGLDRQVVGTTST